MNVLLLPVYWFIGMMLAIGACSAAGMGIAVVIALFKSVAEPKNLGLAIGYVVGCAFVSALVVGGMLLVGWIDGLAGYSGRTAVTTGVVFPGVFGLAIIPQFITIAVKQTSGVEV